MRCERMKCGVGFDSSAGIATGHGLNGQSSGFEFHIQGFLYDGYRFFPGGKAVGAWR